MSATGNPRNKVALKPGHSLMDWIRLGNSGEDLSGTGGAVLQVTKEELAKHNTERDVWTCIRGNVYNITRYMDFHPGGSGELMKGAGIDATTIFNNVHPWVNFESILRKCLVGRLTSVAIEENVFSTPGSSNSSSKLVNNAIKTKPVVPVEEFKIDWYQQQTFIAIVIYLKDFPRKLQLNNDETEELQIFLNDHYIHWLLPRSIIWPPILTVTDSKVEVKFTKEKAVAWPDLPQRLEGEPKEIVAYWPMVIRQIERVNHNVYLISLANSKRILPYVPIGYHVPVKATINGISVERNYTPVCGLTTKLLNDINLLVKSYPDGMLSSWFTTRKAGDSVMVGSPVGYFSVENIAKASHIVLIAAGTGLTPMARIINWSLARRGKVVEVKLLFFNKMEKDIFWRSEIEKLQTANKRFKVEHILSDADTTWKDVRGWVTPQLLHGYIPDISKDDPSRVFICVCGPVSFTQLTERYLQDMGYTMTNYFCFRG